MQALLGTINGERMMTGKPPIAIGIHTDDVIVGNIGSRKRLEYTVFTRSSAWPRRPPSEQCEGSVVGGTLLAINKAKGGSFNEQQE